MRNREQSQSFPKAGATAPPPLNGAEVEQAATATVAVGLPVTPSSLRPFCFDLASPFQSSSLPPKRSPGGRGSERGRPTRRRACCT